MIFLVILFRPALIKPNPAASEYARHLIMRSLQCLGIAYLKEIAWNGRFVKPDIKKEIKLLLDEGKVAEVNIKGLKGPLYMLPVYKKKKITLAGDAFILSPFDILNVFRHRLRDFFGFDYQVECFVPEPKRKYGYFSLPVIIGDVFVARMDSKADRKTKTLIIHNIHFEPVKLSPAMITKLSEAIKAFADFNNCTKINITKTNNKTLVKTISKQLL